MDSVAWLLGEDHGLYVAQQFAIVTLDLELFKLAVRVFKV